MATKVRRNSTGEALVTFMRNAEVGEFPLKRLGDELGVSQKVIQRWQEACRDPAHPMTRELSAIGVAYSVSGAGRGARAILIKGAHLQIRSND
jgi:hypothetical protein